MKRSLSDIVQQLGGHLEGDDIIVHQISPLSQAKSGDICFFNDTKHTASLMQCQASAVIIADKHQHLTALPKIVCDNPYAYFARLSQLFHPMPSFSPGVAASAVIDPSAQIHASCHIAHNVVIGARCRLGAGVVVQANSVIGDDVQIGDHTRIDAHCVLYQGIHIGANCHLSSGVVIGADGFGYAPDHDAWVKIPQVGSVIIGNQVDIGANTTIDRGALDNTVIEDGVKLDNQIQIGHNCKIGAHSVIAGCVGIAGSAKIGSHCRIGGAAMILGHLDIADRVTISPGSMITRSIHQPDTYTALMPFMPHADWLKLAAGLRNIASIIDKLKWIQQRLNRFESQVNTDKKE